jgi:hypothetical protein
MVSAVQQTWSRHGDQRPLEIRWRETGDKLVALGGRIIAPMCETNLDQMERECKRLTPPAPIYNPAVAAAGNEFEATVRRYQAIFDQIKKEQRQLERLRDSDVHRILSDIDDELFKEPQTPQAMIDELFGRQPRDRYASPGQPEYEIPGRTYTPNYDSISGYRQATTQVLEKVFSIDAVKSRMEAVWHFESMPPESQNRRLIVSLSRRIGELEAKIDNLISKRRRK